MTEELFSNLTYILVPSLKEKLLEKNERQKIDLN